MTDRVKYFLLGLLFLVVAGVIAFDRWNSREALMGSSEDARRAARDDGNSGDTIVNPPIDDKTNSRLTIDPAPEPDPNLPPFPSPDPRPAPDPEPAPGPAPGPGPLAKPAASKTHVVKSGESLEAISRLYYPGKVHAGIKLIATANKIENVNRIRERQRLVIPAMNARGVRKPQVQTANKNTRVPSTYTVLASDGDLYSICRRYYGGKGEGRRIKEIMGLNNLWSANVRAGTVLKLPPR
jgi:LysM repeat protein